MNSLTVSISPHVKNRESVPKIMWTVIACLMPVLILSFILYGWRVLALTGISVASCVAVEAACQRLMKRKIRISDGSAVLTGILMAFVLPPGLPLHFPILGAVMAIFIGKQLMGGLGYNIFNPALLARAFLMVTFPALMTTAWILPTPLTELGYPGQWIAALNGMPAVDAVTSATPLGVLSEQGAEAFRNRFGSGLGLYGSFFIGYKPGCIGETSGLLLLIGGLVLMIKKYISWHIPVSMLGTIALLTWIFGGDTLFSGDPLLAVLSGGAILGAFFMATDYVTSPSNKMSQLIFGMAIGALTVLIRLKGGYPEGVCYAILLVNPLSTVLDGWFKRQRFSPAPEPKPEVKAEPNPEVKAEAKEDPKPESKEEPKPESKSDDKSEAKAESKEEPSASDKAETRSADEVNASSNADDKEGGAK
ncbi:MAG: RnfABCDGE type electron transport complex subunit D [Proteobacteria bacterium]|nr:RnfABCDGE type electron transport complex subunit D [Pseudomonadota bacterium]